MPNAFVVTQNDGHRMTTILVTGSEGNLGPSWSAGCALRIPTGRCCA